MIGAIYESEDLAELFQKETTTVLKIIDYCERHNIIIETEYKVKDNKTFRLEIKTVKNGKNWDNGEISSN